MTNANEPRDIRTGQYIHALETMCQCGHTVGDHAAKACDGIRECFAAGCECTKVRKVRAPKR